MPENFEHLLKAPPVDTKFIFGRHHGRYKVKGYVIEARVALRSLLSSGPGAENKFLIISRARSGTSLLRDLLNSHPDINCEAEILASARLFPKTHIHHRVKKHDRPVYGAKILSYQMVQVHGIAEPEEFFRHFHDQGFKFIHLKRNTFWQTFSLFKATSTGVFHTDRHKVTKTKAVEVDIPDFIARLRWSDALLQYETAGLKDIDPLDIDYDTELSQPEFFQATAARIFDYLNVSEHPVETTLRKVLPTRPDDVILNFDALVAEIEREGLSHVLPSSED